MFSICGGKENLCCNLTVKSKHGHSKNWWVLLNNVCVCVSDREQEVYWVTSVFVVPSILKQPRGFLFHYTELTLLHVWMCHDENSFLCWGFVSLPSSESQTNVHCCARFWWSRPTNSDIIGTTCSSALIILSSDPGIKWRTFLGQ